MKKIILADIFQDKKLLKIFTVFLVVLGFIFRILFIEQHSLDHDELGSWQFSRWKTYAELIFISSTRDFNPPGFYLFLHYWISFFGDSALSMRIPSVVAGILLIPILYFFARRLFNNDVGLIACSFASVSLPLINKSQWVRPYSICILLCTISFWAWYELFIVGHNSKKKKLIIAAYIISNCLAIYLHYYVFIGLLFQLTCAFWLYIKNRAKSNFAYCLIPVSFFLPWLFIAMSGHINKKSHFTATSWNMYFDWILQAVNEELICFLIIIAVVINAFFKEKQLNRLNFKNFYILGLITIPYLLAKLVELLGVNTLTLRNLIISLPLLYIVFARIIELIPKEIPKYIIFSILIALMIISGSLCDYFLLPARGQFREAVTTAYDIKKNYLKNSMIITNKSQRCFYYSRHFSKIPPLQVSNEDMIKKLFKKDIPESVIFIESGKQKLSKLFLKYYRHNYRINYREYVEVHLFSNKVTPP